jgi:hypothetical protein
VPSCFSCIGLLRYSLQPVLNSCQARSPDAGASGGIGLTGCLWPLLDLGKDKWRIRRTPPKSLRAQHASPRVAPSKSSRKVSGFRINPAARHTLRCTASSKLNRTTYELLLFASRLPQRLSRVHLFRKLQCPRAFRFGLTSQQQLSSCNL